MLSLCVYRDHFFDSEERKSKSSNGKSKGPSDAIMSSACKGQQGIRTEANYKANMSKMKVSQRLAIPNDALIDI